MLFHSLHTTNNRFKPGMRSSRKYFGLLLLFSLFQNVGLSSSSEPLVSAAELLAEESKADTSLFKSLQAYYLSYGYKYPDSVLLLTKKHLKVAQRVNNREEEATALNERALAFYVSGNKGDALNTIQQAIEVVSTLKDTAWVARMNANMGSLYRDNGKIKEAATHYYKSLEMLRSLNREELSLLEADVLNNLGLLFDDATLYPKALEYLSEASNLYQAAGDIEKSGHLLLNIGGIYSNMDSTLQAIHYTKKSIPILLKDNNLWQASDAYRELYDAYLKEGETDSAKLAIEESLRLAKEIGNERKILISSTLLYALLLKDDLVLSPIELVPLWNAQQYTQDPADLKAVYGFLYEYYKHKAVFDTALSMLEKRDESVAKLANDRVQATMVRVSLEESFKQQLTEEKLQYELKESGMLQQQIVLVALVIVVGLVTIFSIVFMSQRRARKELEVRNHLIQEINRLKNEASRASLAVHSLQLNRERIDSAIERDLNDTDWKILNILLDDPVISNIKLAEKSFLSKDGLGSALRRMYVDFDIEPSRHMKIALLMKVIRVSN